MTAIDVGAPAGTSVYFRIRNTGSSPLTYRFRHDCAFYPGEVKSGVMFLLDTLAGGLPSGTFT